MQDNRIIKISKHNTSCASQTPGRPVMHKALFGSHISLWHTRMYVWMVGAKWISTYHLCILSSPTCNRCGSPDITSGDFGSLICGLTPTCQRCTTTSGDPGARATCIYISSSTKRFFVHDGRREKMRMVGSSTAPVNKSLNPPAPATSTVLDATASTVPVKKSLNLRQREIGVGRVGSTQQLHKQHRTRR
jgi:hypothetical protein